MCQPKRICFLGSLVYDTEYVCMYAAGPLPAHRRFSLASAQGLVGEVLPST